MATLEIFISFFFFFFFFFFFLPHIASGSCSASKCTHRGPRVRFPFWLTNRQDSRCGYPGFGLTCDYERKQTTLTLPSTSGDFFVHSINYGDQIISINDTTGNGCLIKRFLDQEISLGDSAFLYANGGDYKFFNCSPKAEEVLAYYSPLSCLSSDDSKVIAVPSLTSGPPVPSDLCSVMSKVFVPVDSSPYFPPNASEWENVNFGFRMGWIDPDCRYCEAIHRACRLQNATSLQIGCSGPKGLSSAARSGLIIGLGIPGIVCIFAFAMYIIDRMRTRRQQNHLTAELPTVSNEQRPVVTVVGLDGATIESYPKTLLGESVELPNPNDKACSICLAEYQAKQTLRTIPECNHYFHSGCIDEWLRKTPTCPLCRNPPNQE